MAMMRCQDCRREVSVRARTCPHCGAPIAPFLTTLMQAAGVLMFGIGLLTYAIIIGVSQGDTNLFLRALAFLASFLFFTGPAVWVAGRFLAWWYHD